ncbi:MAG: PglZ domain-containing protein [Muribaculaceae bacterium]|nr:PglZ domain-containing protein [Muribaculaceae bacterium]
MSGLINEILTSINRGFHPLTIVSNPDGFLAHEDLLQEFKRESSAEVVVGSAIQLRVHYELHLRRNPDKSAIYILTAGDMLPDITTKANNIRFKIADLFPNFVDKESISQQPLDILSKLYDKHIQGIVTAQRLQDLISDITSAQVAEPVKDFGEAVVNLKRIDNPDWSDVATIRRISELFIKVVEAEKYDEIAETIDYLNFDFQHYLDETYWNSLNANPILKPQCVNGIVPHIRHNYQSSQKVALVVVDGMAFWQYEVLLAELKTLHIYPTQEHWTYSWIPSITCLSRQAIFTRQHPSLDYIQSPNNERLAWLSHWHTGFPQYLYDNGDGPLPISNDCRRLALVTVALDEKMHSSTSYIDLLVLTRIWAKSFAKRFKQLKDSGFDIILTTDHGNVLSKGWRTFTSIEKAHLYGKASRGHRHAIFMQKDASDQFNKDLGYSIQCLHKQLWFAIRDDNSFNTPGRVEITHGGSHFFECMIPFIKF